MGGKHAEPEHLNLLMDCARICVTNADFMLRKSKYYQQTCGKQPSYVMNALKAVMGLKKTS